MLLMLICGTGTTITNKLMDEETVVTDAGKSTKFNHPYFQCAVMFFGEFIVIFLYMYKQISGSSQQSEFNMTLLAIPSLFDIIATSLCMIALTMVAGSVF